MRKFDESSREIQKLEEEIRKLGVPYANSEPEPLYWANFRVRAIERIEARQQRAPLHTRILEFLAEHLLWTTISAATACLLVAAILTFQPSGSQSPQLAELPPAPAAPALTAAPSTSSEPAMPSTVKEAAHVSHRTDLAKAPTKRQSEDLAVAEPFAASPSEEAVSLQSLSEPELEAVLDGLQSNTSGNE